MIDLATAPNDDILARTIAGEARGEDYMGMQAVANVVMNRVAHPKWWGHTVKEICLKPYQFSCWLLGDPNRAIILALDDKPIWPDCLDIARKAIAGELPDLTNGATSYYAKGTPKPGWAENQTPCAVIGHHLFFKDV